MSSTIKERADLEAAIAEADLDDETEERVKELHAEGSPIEDAIRLAIEERDHQSVQSHGGDDPAEGLEQPTSKMLAALEDAKTSHVDRVHQIMGSFVEGFEPCAECDRLGLVPPAPAARGHEFFKACPTCNGYGQLKTGSLSEQFAAIECVDCAGRGFLERMVDFTPASELVKQLREQRAATTIPDVVAPPASPVADPAAGDGFGRPSWMGDPAIGA